MAALRQQALDAAHARSRERFPALHEIARGDCATRVAGRTGRHPQTVMEWLHTYNEHGPEALSYRRTGGRPLFVRRWRPPPASRFAPVNRPPPAPRLPGRTLKRLAVFVTGRFGLPCRRETIRAALKRLKLSWKKARKLHGRANTERRETFLRTPHPLLKQARRDRIMLVYLDEAHIHQDVDLGHGWGKRGKRFHAAAAPGPLRQGLVLRSVPS